MSRPSLCTWVVAGAVAAAAGAARAAPARRPTAPVARRAPVPPPSRSPAPLGSGLPRLPGLANPAVRAVGEALDHREPARALALAEGAGRVGSLDPKAAPALAFLRALALMRLGRRAEALGILGTLDGPAAPPGLEAHVAWYHGELLAAGGRLQDAAAALAAVPVGSRFGLKAATLRVRAMLDRGDVAGACRLAQDTADARVGAPGEDRAWVLLAGCLVREAGHLARMGDHRGARARLRAAAALDRGVATLWPWRPSGRYAKAELHRLVRDGVRPNPPKVDALVRRARRAVLEVHPRRAIRTVRRLRRLLPRGARRAGAELDLMTAELYVHIRWFRHARWWLRRVEREAPSPGFVAAAAVIRADLLARWRRIAAFDAYLDVADAHPHTDAAALALRRAGRIAARSGDPATAAALYRRCAENHPASPVADDCRFGLAWLAWTAGRGDAARAWLATLLGPEAVPPRPRTPPAPAIPRDVVGLPPVAEPLLRGPAGTPPVAHPVAVADPPADPPAADPPGVARPDPPAFDVIVLASASAGTAAATTGAGIAAPALGAVAAAAAPAISPGRPLDPLVPTPEAHRVLAVQSGLAIRFHPDGRPEAEALAHRRLLEKAAYWRGRIQEMQGHAAAARRDYLDVASVRPLDYYGLLAWDRLTALGVDASAAVARRRPPDPVVPPPKASGLDPDVAAAAAYLRMGLTRDARRTLLRLDRGDLVDADRRTASRLWTRLADLRRAHRLAPIAWQGGLPAFPAAQTATDARLAYPRPWRVEVDQQTAADGVPEALLYALIRAESGFEPRARSAAGALGLTQVMFHTAYPIARHIGLRHFHFWKLRRPDVSIAVGAAFLARLLSDFHGRIALAVAAYNAGEHAVKRWLAARGNLPLDAFVEEIPISETRRYVQKVLSFFAIYRALYAGRLAHPLGIDPTRPVWQTGDSDSPVTPPVVQG